MSARESERNETKEAVLLNTVVHANKHMNTTVLYT